MKEIPLRGRYGEGKFAFVDDEDYERVIRYSWAVREHRWSSPGVKRIRFRYIPQARIKGRTIAIHRFILYEPKGLVDHKDHNLFNNQKCNLRICTPRQNSCNRVANLYSTSKYVGVSWDRENNKWLSKIKFYGTTYTLGRFTSDIEAAQNYDYHAIIMNGEFAGLNFPDYDYSNFVPKRVIIL